MSRKAFLVQVELEIQAVTCPGVWLCSNGKVCLQMYMLDSCVQTANYKPTFPIQCNETFIFYKTFYSQHRLNELQKELHNQWLYIELVQWKRCEIGNVLASFQTTLDELLFPSTYSGSIAGVDLDLLMEPSKHFPGVIAPKIEISTKTTIEETLCSCKKPSSSTVIVNPKVLTSSEQKPRRNICRKVCHSIAYSRRQRPLRITKRRPPFLYRRAEDDLILRKPQDLAFNEKCGCRQSRSLERNINVRKIKPEFKPKDCSPAVRMCSCGSGHRENLCPVCAKYKGYFNVKIRSRSPEPEKKQESGDRQARTNLYDTDRNNRCPCCRRTMAYNITQESDSQSADSNLSDSEVDKRRSCPCNPEKKQSLAEKLHAKLTKTLGSIEWPCYVTDEECGCYCPCASANIIDNRKRAELYHDLQKFYGDLYEKTRANALCVPDCPGAK